MADVAPQRLRELLDAVVAVGSELDLQTMLLRVTEMATDLVDARFGALGVLDESGTGLEQFVTAGIDEAGRRAIGDLPAGRGILGLLIVEAEPIRLPDLTRHPDRYGFPPGHPEMHSFLGVPIVVGGRAFGNLYLTEKRSEPEFSEADEELVVGLAAAAGVAIENTRLHARLSDLVVYEDRERIARDLHDTVIQRLFATGLSLQGAAALVESDPSAVRARLESAVDDLDETVKHIRTSIFALESSRSSHHGLRDRVLGLCRESSGALGFEPVVVFDGAVDSALDHDVATDLLATLREALSNVAKHARASRVEVSVAATDETVSLEVFDDGVGLDPAASSGHGLPNMRARAERHGGELDIESRARPGTTLLWRVPAG